MNFFNRRRARRSRLKKFIAYDLETTPLAAGNPAPLYLTAYGADFHYSGRLTSIEHLGEILRARFLTPELAGYRFMAWNGNQFDVFFVGAALLHFRFTMGWRRRRAAIMAVIGFAAALFTLWGVSFLMKGLHTYVS